MLRLFSKRAPFSAVMLTALVIGLYPQSGEAFSAGNGIKVYQINSSSFEVVPRSSGSTADFWCGASQYARRVLGAGWSDQIYVVRGRGPSEATNKRSAVQFTLTPEQAGLSVGRKGFFTTGLKTGDYMSVQQGNAMCTRDPVRP